jgi:hypothetical protein
LRQARECLLRNEMREGKARVPDVAIYATAKKLVAPSVTEGFDELRCVRPNDSTFEVCGRRGRVWGVLAVGPGNNETYGERLETWKENGWRTMARSFWGSATRWIT